MGKFHEEKVKLMEKYLPDIVTGFDYDIGDYVPLNKLHNAAQKFASGLDPDTVIGFYDTTVMSSGKNGYLFTDDKLYWLETLEKPKKIWYEDIDHVEIYQTQKKDRDQELTVFLRDGSSVALNSSFLNKPPLKEFLEKMKDFDKEESQKQIQVENARKSKAASFAGSTGLGVNTYRTVNKLYDEEKFHARQGHGFAAERANTLYDRLTGHDAKIVGDDNGKNGADRIVDGVSIQSKYCATGARCVNECFEDNGNGAFRYMENGKPMQIEVPSDKYDEAVRAMEEKIRRGQVKGVSNPDEAKKIIRKGHFDYTQARNLAKAGTVESLTYDAVTGTVTAVTSFGVSGVITFATAIWKGEDFDQALRLATYSGLKVGGTAFLTSVLAGQLSKAGLNTALVGSSEVIVAMMGPKASAVLINAFRFGKAPIYGAAAMKSAAKLLRGNVITAGVTFVVLSSFDVVNIFRGRISGKQLFKNLTTTAASVGAGSAGFTAGAALGSAILPGIGTFVGGLIGSGLAGMAAGTAVNKAVGAFVEDDANEMVKIIEKVFTDMAGEYLLNQKEAEKCADRLQDKLSGKTLKDMYASGSRSDFARDLLTPIIEQQVESRPVIHALTSEEMVQGVREVLEEIADASEETDEAAAPAEEPLDVNKLLADTFTDIFGDVPGEGSSNQKEAEKCADQPQDQPNDAPSEEAIAQQVELSPYSGDNASYLIYEINYWTGIDLDSAKSLIRNGGSIAVKDPKGLIRALEKFGMQAAVAP